MGVGLLRAGPVQGNGLALQKGVQYRSSTVVVRYEALGAP